jgi:hypothetical protein
VDAAFELRVRVVAEGRPEATNRLVATAHAAEGPAREDRFPGRPDAPQRLLDPRQRPPGLSRRRGRQRQLGLALVASTPARDSAASAARRFIAFREPSPGPGGQVGVRLPPVGRSPYPAGSADRPLGGGERLLAPADACQGMPGSR